MSENEGKDNKFLVCAIDFGTTYSGYAYSFFSEFKKDNMKVCVNEFRYADKEDVFQTVKVPTTVLFDQNDQFHSFGFEAENKYLNLTLEGQHNGWKYFKRFKMALMKILKRPKERICLVDDQGKRKAAQEVVSAAISYMKEHFVEALKKYPIVVTDRDIHYVVTVPAIWHDRARQFMFECAVMAGIQSDRLSIALEPECAAISCYAWEATMHAAFGSSFTFTSVGSQFMVIDCGGGTVDITVYEVDNEWKLVEMAAPSGGPWGGTCVDKAFCSLIEQLLTSKGRREFQKAHKDDDLELQRAFEMKKRAFKRSDERFNIRLPYGVFKVLAKTPGDDLKDELARCGLTGKVQTRLDKAFFDSSVMIDLLVPTVNTIIRHLKTLLEMPDLKKVSSLLLIGGFSECFMIIDAVKNAFPTMNVITPTEPELAVVKGAVMFGFNKDKIRSRKMRYTIGISTAVPFDKQNHPEDKKAFFNGVERCEDVFKVFIAKGDDISRGKTIVNHSFNYPYMGPEAEIEVYESTNRAPKFVHDQDCSPLGKLEFNFGQYLDNGDNKTPIIHVQMAFGDTQVEVKARVNNNDKWDSNIAKFNLLC